VARLSDKQKKQIVADYVETGSYRATARNHGVSANTVKSLVSANPETAQKCADKKEQVEADILAELDSRASKVLDLYDKGLDRIAQVITETKDPQRIAMALGILIDKQTKRTELSFRQTEVDVKRRELALKEPQTFDEDKERQRQYYGAYYDLWEYCKLKAPDFYTEDVTYLWEMCRALQEFEKDENELLVINIPPRMGKTRTAGLAAQWYLGRNPLLKLIVASYNEKLSRQLSKAVRDSIMEIKAQPDIAVFSDVFPEIEIKDGAGGVDLWALNKSPQNNYLATSPKATVTGLGGNMIIVDDTIKNAYEAFHAGILEDLFTWFTDTMFSRLEGRRKVIVTATRWATKDLAGRLISMYQEQGRKIKIITKKAFDGNKLLNERIMDMKAYESIRQTIGEDIFQANYNQEPLDLKGRLYGEFVTYTETPQFKTIKAMCDTADEGSDYLCNVVYGETGGNDPEAYVLDVLYTQASMDETEKAIVKQLVEFNVDEITLESNFGGKGWKKVLQGEYEKAGGQKCRFRTYIQKYNKEAKILAAASTVTRKIIMPVLWKQRFPKFFTDVTEFQRTGKNAHDDAPDCLSEITLRLGKGGFIGA